MEKGSRNCLWKEGEIRKIDSRTRCIGSKEIKEREVS